MRRRRGFSLTELMIVIVLLGVIASLVLPRIGDLRSQSGLRSARSLVLGSLSAARGAAIQKGKIATLTMANSTLTVKVLSGIRPDTVQVQGPVNVSKITGAVLAPLNDAPLQLAYDARGLVTPVRNTISRYELRLGNRADTLCVTGAGTIMPKGCVL